MNSPSVDRPFRRATGLFIIVILPVAVIALASARQRPPDFLAADIDPSVSPGTDFFQYANGGWLKRNPIPEDHPKWGISDLVSEEVYAQIRAISEEAVRAKAPRGSAQQLIGAVWSTAMDAATINRQSLAPLQPDLERIDQIGSVGDVIDFIAVLHRRSMLIDDFFEQPGVLFRDGAEQDESQSDRWIYGLSSAAADNRATSATGPQSAPARDAFREYLFRTFLRLHRDSGQARASADAVFNLEARLAASVVDSGGQPRRMGLAELGRLTPTLDWNRYFRDVGATGLDTVTVRNVPFFQTIDAILRTTSIDDWKDYLRFWLVRLNAPFLDDGTFDEFFAYKRALTGVLQPRPRWQRVVWQEKHWLGLPLADLYVGKYFPQNTVGRYQAMGAAIRRAFHDRIERVGWMSDPTKRAALLKLDRLKITLGYPEHAVDLSTLSLQEDSYVLNMIRSAEWFHDQEIKRLNTVVDRTAVDLHPDISPDPEYDFANNEVRLAGPEIVPGVADRALDDAFVYGATTLGHEVSHAFDSEGRHYDANGNKVDWWTVQDAAAFDARAQVLVDEYDAFTTLDGRHLNGRSSLAENMADLVGLRIRLDAFKQTDQFKKNERVGGFTPLQRFFLAYAYANMNQARREPVGGYAPSRLRVNGVVMNIPEFYEAFGVRPGDAMYRPENSRVMIW